MTVSIQSNQSALVALNNLNKTTADLEKTQERVSSGLEVAKASDDPTRFSVSRELRADIDSLDSVGVGLDRAISTGEVAVNAGETVSDLLIQMREKALSAVDSSLDSTSRSALNADFTALIDQIASVLESADFDGVNLIDGSQSGGVEFLADADATRTMTLRTQDLSFAGAILTFDPATTDLSTASNASAALAEVIDSFENVNSALGELSSDLKQLDAHNDFVSRLQDTLETGVGQLVDADLAAESARLEALQVQQQLSIESLSIANTSPDAILSLFQS